MTALNGTIPFTKMANISILVAGNLYLYMAWLLHELLHVNTIVPECSRSLGLRCIIGPLHISLFPDYAHALAATACRCLQDDGVAPVSYTRLRAHETPEHLVCRLLLEKKK